MCGIIAIIHKNNTSLVEKALKKIQHRGLDSSKIISFENYSFGFNRLAINDKSEIANQPYEYGNLIGLINGEIYNFKELKKEYNLTTNSNSDTEIILPLFDKFGSSIIHYLDGFYSGIIYNKATNQLFFLRDYIGKKPLFYGTAGDYEFIVSELKAVDTISSFQIVSKGFSELIDGTIKTIENHNIPKNTETNLKQIVTNAVEKRIPKKEKLFGVFLSGGLDSSIIAKVVSNLATNVIYYTLGNDNSQDLHFVKTLMNKLGIEQKLKIINLPNPNEIPELINKVVYYTESYNPSIISNGLATFLLSQAAHQDGIKVVLSGEGADELFCGYPISKTVNQWFEKRTELIENMHFTELRRLDLASMVHTIEIRCPFLDREIYAASNDCSLNELIKETANGIIGKQILREAFANDIPSEIVERNKMSFDVGSGIRKLVVEYLTQNNKTEKEKLKEIWNNHFPDKLANHEYFHSYPTFDKAIEKRGINHK